MGDLPQVTPLGALWSYNNAGFYLAGRVIEAVCYKPFETVVREMVLEPLRMQRSYFNPADVITYRTASGHDAVYDDKVTVPPVSRPWALARSGNPAGGLISTTCDLLKYARFQLSEGPALLTPQSMILMHTPRVKSSGDEWVGLTWFVREVGGARVLRHGGATNGFTATFEFVPSKRFAIIVLTNSDRGPELYHPLVSKALAEFLGLEEKEKEPMQIGEAELAKYAGLYTAASTDLTLYPKDGGLWVKSNPKGGFPTKDSPPSPPPPEFRIGFISKDRVVGLDIPMKGNHGEFLRSESGEIVWFRLSGRIHKRQ
jgi:CubicO group peptidase (beta-lactamase class C family)